MAVNKVVINNETVIDLTADTVTADKLMHGITAHSKDGSLLTGTIRDGDSIEYGSDEKIPAAYQKVEYVVSPGSGAHLNTGAPGNDETLEIELCYEMGQWAAYRGFWGNYYNESSNCWRLIFTSSQKGTLYASANTKASSSAGVTFGDSLDAIMGEKIYVSAKYQSIEITIDGITKTASPSVNGSENTRPIAIGRSGVNSADTSASDYGCKWYYIKIRSGGELIRWYVPCYRKTDNAVGFWDVINKTFNTSYGQVEFTLE